LTEKRLKKKDTMTRQVLRYSNCFKRNVVESIERDGLSIEDCRRLYGIGGSETIQKWIRKFGKNELLNKLVMVQTLDERDELKRLREEVKRLKVAYADLAIAHRIDQKVIEVADELYGFDLKKKYEQELSQHLKEKQK
jgi:transposase-like protein